MLNLKVSTEKYFVNWKYNNRIHLKNPDKKCMDILVRFLTNFLLPIKYLYLLSKFLDKRSR